MVLNAKLWLLLDEPARGHLTGLTLHYCSSAANKRWSLVVIGSEDIIKRRLALGVVEIFYESL